MRDRDAAAGSHDVDDRRRPAPSHRPGRWSHRLGAEALGTFALVFVAAGADTFSVISQGEVTPLARAVAPGLLVGAMIYAISDASGAHFNPVVTLAFALKRLVPPSWLPAYWGAQLVGALAAAALLRVLFGDAAAAGVSASHHGVGPVTTVVIEAVLTWLLLTVILGTADRARVVGSDAALAVGATIALCGLIALPIEGASMNPARSLGPAIVEGRLDGTWPYLLGPVCGAILALGSTRLVHGVHDSPASSEAARGDGG